ncbi:MAG TPA: hypothetical protein VG347_15390 [Verrucomicrobiae bacterium]|nr:hypothetical protein [Verrucomicrobiae bacterium]
MIQEHHPEAKKAKPISGDVIPYENPKALAEFLNQPQVKIAELVTGALALDKSGVALLAGRIVQGALKGNLMRQVGRELQSLVKKGRINEDYADSKYGFQTLSELLAFIDSDAPDQDRFKATKAIFYAVIDKDSVQGSEILKYQIFQIVKRLSSSQLLTLNAAKRMKDAGVKPTGSDQWRTMVAEAVGHKSAGLVYNDEDTLVRERLIGETMHSDRSGINNSDTARLTDLGIALVEMIKKYEDFGSES